MRRTAIKIGLLFISFMLISGCGLRRPSQQDLLNADYGSYPSNYEQIIKNHMSERLFDPYSAVYNFQGSPQTGWQNDFGRLHYGYRGIVTINAKNRMGGYVGATSYNYMIKNDTVIYMREQLRF